MKYNIPNIRHDSELVPPECPDDNTLYIMHYAFYVKTATTVIKYRTDLKCFELYSFELKTAGCKPGSEHDVYKLEQDMTPEMFAELVSDELYNWLEYNSPLRSNIKFSIREWNQELLTAPCVQLKNAIIECPGIHPSDDEEPWINVYDGMHIEGKDFKIEFLDMLADHASVKMKITGLVEERPILYQGWTDLEYIDPRYWFEQFVNKVNTEGRFQTYYYYFSRQSIELNPQWNELTGDYEQRLIQLAGMHGLSVSLFDDPDELQQQWLFKPE